MFFCGWPARNISRENTNDLENMIKPESKSTNVSSRFSVFIREAKSRDKKRVYRKVIEDSNSAQNHVIKLSRECAPKRK